MINDGYPPYCSGKIGLCDICEDEFNTDSEIERLEAENRKLQKQIHYLEMTGRTRTNKSWGCFSW